MPRSFPSSLPLLFLLSLSLPSAEQRHEEAVLREAGAEMFALGSAQDSVDDSRVHLHAPELNHPLNSYEYEPTGFRGRDQEVFSAAAKSFPGRIEARTHPHDLGASIEAISRATGLAIRFFSVEGNGSPEVGGFLSPSHPGIVFLNTGSPARIANILAHEWAHGLAKDAAKSKRLAR